MLIDLPCARCGRSVWLPWADYLDVVASNSPRHNCPYVCQNCRPPATSQTPEEA
jgi:hypothetical protein